MAYRDQDPYRARPRRTLRERRRAGWGLNLYRNTRRGRIGGVAAGLADHWDVAPWVVRLLWVGAFLFTGTLALWAYLGAWIALAPRHSAAAFGAGSRGGGREEREPEEAMEYDEYRHQYRPRKVFRYPEPASVRLQRARERLDAAQQRVEAMESYVTSRQYALDRELSRL